MFDRDTKIYHGPRGRKVGVSRFGTLMEEINKVADLFSFSEEDDDGLRKAASRLYTVLEGNSRAASEERMYTDALKLHLKSKDGGHLTRVERKFLDEMYVRFGPYLRGRKG